MNFMKPRDGYGDEKVSRALMKLRRKVSSLPPLSIPYPDSYIFPLDTDTCIRHDFAFCVLLRFLDPPTFISFLPNLNFVSFFIVLSDFAGFDRQRWSGRRLRSTKIESSWWNESRNSRDYQGIGIYRRNGSRARLPTRIRATFRRHGRLIECVKRGLVVNSYTEKGRERERDRKSTRRDRHWLLGAAERDGLWEEWELTWKMALTKWFTMLRSASFHDSVEI